MERGRCSRRRQRDEEASALQGEEAAEHHARMCILQKAIADSSVRLPTRNRCRSKAKMKLTRCVGAGEQRAWCSRHKSITPQHHKRQFFTWHEQRTELAT
eukprot:TRINITY_DN69101_c0_g1_i1.p2 TRINITY_DN69101_c0_g1~~TRINITY_DN69101_c0_g1_i1.p2  ORF type:complete len:100 (-),score=13.64 TRINITY_DN69101_c0_g1_i1:56-355(-)